MTNTSEDQRLEDIAANYSAFEGFNKAIIDYGFRSIQEHFHGASCLELGTADGVMTRQLASAFDDLTSIDGSQRYAELIAEQLGPEFPGLTVIHTLFEDFQPDRRFDTVIAAHILEHVDDPVAVARRALDWVAPGGKLLVLVPNAHSFNRLLGVKMGMIQTPDELVEGDHAVGHRRVYTPATLHADLTAAGWDIACTSGVLFKPLSNAQMYESYTHEMLEGCWLLGKDFPDNAGDILCVCTPPA